MVTTTTTTTTTTHLSPLLSPILLLLLLLVLPCPLLALSLPSCTDRSQQNQGYTFTLDPDTGERLWSFCDFPDPRHDHAYCGLPDWSEPSFICDPDNLIGSDEDARTINSQLRSIQTTTSRQCSGPDGGRQGYVAAIILVNRLRIGAPYDADSCFNDCGEIHPTINTTARTPTNSEIDVAMETFANGVRQTLNLGACGNDLILVYSQALNRVYTSMGGRVDDQLDSSELSELHSRFLDYVGQGDLEQALLYVAQQLASDLRGLTPAIIMLIITLVAAALLLLFMVFFLHVSDIDYNAWGHDEGLSKMADVAVKTVTGVYVIDGVMRATAHISGRVPAAPVLAVMVVVGVGCLVVFSTTDNIYTRPQG